MPKLCCRTNKETQISANKLFAFCVLRVTRLNWYGYRFSYYFKFYTFDCRIFQTDVENVKVADLIWLSMSTLQHLCADEAMFRQILYYLKLPEFAAGPQRLLLPLFVLSQPQNNENIQRSALGLLNELANDQEVCLFHMLIILQMRSKLAVNFFRSALCYFETKITLPCLNNLPTVRFRPMVAGYFCDVEIMFCPFSDVRFQIVGEVDTSSAAVVWRSERPSCERRVLPTAGCLEWGWYFLLDKNGNFCFVRSHF